MLALGGLFALWIQLEDETKQLLPRQYVSHAVTFGEVSRLATNSIT